MKVPFLDMWRMHEGLETKFQEIFNSVLKKNQFTQGDGQEKFEKSFASRPIAGAGFRSILVPSS